MRPRTLSHAEARRAYDRIGRLQDSQAFYEDVATSRLLQHGDFPSAQSVFEFGCGTGRFAHRLLEEHLPPGARYRGVDLSPRMIGLAQARLRPWAPRAGVRLTEGGPPSDEPPASCDRFVSNYVFDLLAIEEIEAVLREAQRMLQPGGLLCTTGLSTGIGRASRGMARAWGWVQSRAPSLVGGCRPVDVLPLLPAEGWEVRRHSKLVRFGLTSEVLVARRLG
ncbi:MAG TPA: class I SAM-dependent methyltransferase [Solirubrobacterales bacterium]|nr:class I SAM-dependent methyltransferase [Solirubrobacterales bacterium]